MFDRSTLTIGLVGYSSTGKTTFLDSYKKLFATSTPTIAPFAPHSTIGVQFKTLPYTCADGHTIYIQFWDSSGEEKYKRIVKHHLSSCDALLFFYDVTSLQSFSILRGYIDLMTTPKENFGGKEEFQSRDAAPCIEGMRVLLGTKLDLVNEDCSQRDVDISLVKKLAGELQADFHEISAKVDSVGKNPPLRKLMVELVEEVHQLKNLREISRRQKEWDSLGRVMTSQDENEILAEGERARDQSTSEQTAYCGRGCRIY